MTNEQDQAAKPMLETALAEANFDQFPTLAVTSRKFCKRRMLESQT